MHNRPISFIWARSFQVNFIHATKFFSLFGSSASVIVKLSDAIEGYKSLRNEQTEANANRQTNKQTDRKKKLGVKKNVIVVSSKQLSRSMKRHKVLVSSPKLNCSGFMQKYFFEESQAKPRKIDEKRRKDFLFIWWQVNCENLCHWISRSE